MSSPDSRQFAPLDARDAWILSGLIAVFVASRVLWLSWALPSSIYWEESYRFVAAKEILTAPILPLLDYQADHYQGGSLVMILLTVALFRAFGASVFVMKFAALIVSTLILTLLYVVGRKAFDRRTAWLAGLAYVCGPPIAAYFGLTVMGFHAESTAFSLAELLMFYGMLAGVWRTRLGFAAFGFVSILGMWFCYTSGLSVAACVFAWPLMAAVPRLRELAWGVAGALAGLAPWLAYNIPRGFAGVGRLLDISGVGRPIDPAEPYGLLRKLAELVGRDWPNGILLPFANVDEPYATLLKVCFLVPFAVGLAASVFRVATALASRVRGRWRGGKEVMWPPETVFVVYGVIFVATFLSARFSVDPANQGAAYRLFVPPAVLFLLPVAYAAACALRRTGAVRMLTIVACTTYLASSALGTVALAARVPNGLRRITTRNGDIMRGVLLHRKFESNLPRAFAEARLLGDPSLHYCVLQGIGWGMEYRFESDGQIAPIRRQLSRLPRSERPGVLAGLQWGAMQRLRTARSGRATLLRNGARNKLLVRRLTRLQTFIDSQWRTVPEYRLINRVIYPDQR